MTEGTIANWNKVDDLMVENAIRRGASRRDLLRLLAAGGISAAAGVAIIGRAHQAVASSPTPGGTLKAAGVSASTADTLDPAKSLLSTDYVRTCAFYNRLTFLDKSSIVQMELADSIETKDAKVWTVKLRKGVTFHDGKTLTSDDVIFSLKRHQDPSVGSQVVKFAEQMKEFKAIDKSTVEITLASPNADLPTILAMHQFMIVADGTTDFSKGNGTGSFVVESFEPGVRSIGVKNKNYWKSGAPYLDAFEFFAISDDNARVNALLSGDIQLAWPINPRATKLVEGQPGFALNKNILGNYVDLNMRLDMTPGDKKDFVVGMKYLINREQIKSSVLRGLAEIANDQPISPANFYCNRDLAPKPYDPDKAKFHFEKAGALGQAIPIIASEAATASIDIAMVIQQAGADIGMKFDVQRVPSDGYWDKYWAKAPVHFGDINPRPTPDIIFSLLYASDGPWNETGFKSEKFDKMLLEARGSLDQAKRKELYDAMQVIIAEEAGTAIPVWLSNVEAFSTKLQGLESNPLGPMMGYAFAEYVWLQP